MGKIAAVSGPGGGGGGEGLDLCSFSRTLRRGQAAYFVG